jgi:hypothetical protein
MKRALALVAFVTVVSSCLLPSVDLQEQPAGGGAGGVASPAGGTAAEAGDGAAGRSGDTDGGAGGKGAGGKGTGGKGTGGMNAGGTGSSGAATGGMSAGGTSTGGGAGRAGGSSGGAGGTSAGASGSGAGGMSGGAGGGSGMAGSSGSPGTAGAPNLLPIVGSWDGALLTYACGQTGSSYDCAEPTSAACMSTATGTPSLIPSSNGMPSSWTIAGTTGTVYSVTVRIRGMVEVTSYVGGTRDQGDTSITVSTDLFQQGGSPQAAGGVSFDYNTYELDVTPPVAGAANTYFLNSVTTTENPHAPNSPTSHLTFPIDYTKTIKVTGGGQVQLKVSDSNCLINMNCGAVFNSQCSSPRSVSLAGSTPAAPSSFVQPFSGEPATRYGQWLFFDVTNVTLP